MSYRAQVVETAERTIGKGSGELGLCVVLDGTWCGVYVLSVLHACGLARDIPHGPKSGQALRETLPRIEFAAAQPGDVVAWGKHVAILRRYESGELHTIDGTEGPGSVYTAVRKAHRFNCNVYSIQPLIDAAAEWTGAESL